MVGGVTNMKKIFFAFLDELAHSKQFWEVGKMTFPWLPPPKVRKIPEILKKFLDDAFPKCLCVYVTLLFLEAYNPTTEGNGGALYQVIYSNSPG